MRDKSINLQRTESFLKEIIPEAFSSLDDVTLNSLGVIEVDCKKGKYDALVYLDATFLNDKDKKEVLATLRRVNSRIKGYISNASGWYRVPKLTYKFDNSLEKRNKIDDLFAQISSELHDKSEK